MRLPILILLLAVSVKVSFGERRDLRAVPSDDNGLRFNSETHSSRPTTWKTTFTYPKSTWSTTTRHPKSTRITTPRPTTPRSPTTRLNPFTNELGEEISRDIWKFAENLVKETLQLKTYKCDELRSCFPVDLSKLKVETLVSIQTLLQHIYHEDYEKIMKIPALDNGVGIEAGKISRELYEGTRNTVLMWMDNLERLENRSASTWTAKINIRHNLDIMSLQFVKIMDIQKSREALDRMKRILNPVLKRKTSARVVRHALKNSDFLDDPAFSVRSNFLNKVNGTVFDKKKVAAEVEKLFQRIFIYIYKVDPAANKLGIIGFDDSIKFSDFSLQTLVAFKYFLLKAYGPILKDIPLVPMTSAADKHEKLDIVQGIQNIWNATIDIWITNFNALIQGNYQNNAQELKKQITTFTESMGNFLELDELRLIYRKTLSLLGKAFDVINSERSDFMYAELGLEKKRQVRHKADIGIKDIKAGGIGDRSNEELEIEATDTNENLDDSQNNIGGRGANDDQVKENDVSA